MINKYYDKFENYGGDIENLLQKVKMAQRMRFFLNPNKELNILDLIDFKNGLDTFLKHRYNNNNISYNSMYL